MGVRFVTIEERLDSGLNRVLARFAFEGELPPVESLDVPDVALLVEVREFMFDYIKEQKEKALKAYDDQAKKRQRDADLVTGVVEVQAAMLASAEATAAHAAAQKKKAEEAVAEAQEKVNEAKMKAAKEEAKK